SALSLTQPADDPRIAGRASPRHRATRRASDQLFAAVPAVWLFVFFIAPLGFTVAFSFGHADFGGVRLGFTLDNYANALSGFYLEAFLRTIRFAVTGCALCLL